MYKVAPDLRRGKRWKPKTGRLIKRDHAQLWSTFLKLWISWREQTSLQGSISNPNHCNWYYKKVRLYTISASNQQVKVTILSSEFVSYLYRNFINKSICTASLKTKTKTLMKIKFRMNTKIPFD